MCQKTCSFLLPLILQNEHGSATDDESAESHAGLRREAAKAPLPILAWPLGCTWTQTSLVMKAFPMSVCFLSISLTSGKSCCSGAWSPSKMPGERTDAL